MCGGGGTALVNLGAWCVAHCRMASAGSALLQAQSKDPNNEGLWLTQALLHEAVAAATAAAAAAAATATTGGDAPAGPAAAAAAAASPDGGAGGDGNEQALAAFSLAADLALSPAAVTPSALHALQLLGSAAAAATGDDVAGGGAMPGRAAATRTTLPLASPLEVASFAEVGAARDPTNPLAALLHVEAALVFAAAMTRRCLPPPPVAAASVAAPPDGESELPAMVGDLLARTRAATAPSSREHTAAAPQCAGTSDVDAAGRLWRVVEGLAAAFVGRWGGCEPSSVGAGGRSGPRAHDAAITEARMAVAVAKELQQWCGAGARV